MIKSIKNLVRFIRLNNKMKIKKWMTGRYNSRVIGLSERIIIAIPVRKIKRK